MATILAFDCAVSGLTAAVLRDGSRLASLARSGRDQAAYLLPAIETVVVEAGIGRHDVELVAVTIGPGSFTGVRVGLAAARGLALGLGVPLAGISTTSVLLAQAVPRGRIAIAAVDSHLGNWFCAICTSEGSAFAATPGELSSRLEGRACHVIGAGAEVLAVQLRVAGVDATAEEAVPDSVVLGRMAARAGVETWRNLNRRQGLPRPLYLRGVNITLPDGMRRTVD